MKWIFLLTLIPSLLWSQPRTQVHMGTLINVDVEETSLSDQVFELFDDLDHLLSTYKPDSEISRLNQHHTAQPSPVTRRILERSMEMYLLSHGAFDITIGSITHGAYRFGTADEHLPSQKEIDKMGQFVGNKRITFEGDFVKIQPGTTIDLGGIGKGFAVDLAIELLTKQHQGKAIIAASGDISCLGECTISVQNPFIAHEDIATITSSLPRLSVSTSGNYERYIKTKAHNHLIDPKTLKPQQWFASVTLVDTQDNTRLDALATAVSVMEESKAIEMLESLSIGYLLIRNDTTRLMSQIPSGVTLSLH